MPKTKQRTITQIPRETKFEREESAAHFIKGSRVRSKTTGRMGTYISMHEGFSLPEVWISWDSETESNVVASANPIDRESVLKEKLDTEQPDILAALRPTTQAEVPIQSATDTVAFPGATEPESEQPCEDEVVPSQAQEEPRTSIQEPLELSSVLKSSKTETIVAADETLSDEYVTQLNKSVTLENESVTPEFTELGFFSNRRISNAAQQDVAVEEFATPACVEVVDELSADEAADRQRLEQRVERGFYTSGAALRELRDRRLYRDTHRTWEQYCQSRFG